MTVLHVYVGPGEPLGRRQDCDPEDGKLTMLIFPFLLPRLL
jgi:hypothetical protein